MNNGSLEELYADLFAYRIYLQDTISSESIIINELERYLIIRNYSNDNINQILLNFYKKYEMEELFNSIVRNQHNNLFFPFNLNNANLFINLGNNLFLNNPQQNNILNEDNNEDEYNNENIENIGNIFSEILNTASLLNRQIVIIDENENDDEEYNDIVVTLDTSELEKLKKFQLENKLDFNCVVCLADLEKDEHAIELNCGHIYHSDCIETYLKEYSYKCPICRKEVGKSHYNI